MSSEIGPLPPEIVRLFKVQSEVQEKITKSLPPQIISELHKQQQKKSQKTFNERIQVPYACLFIDASWKDLLAALSYTIYIPTPKPLSPNPYNQREIIHSQLMQTIHNMTQPNYNRKNNNNQLSNSNNNIHANTANRNNNNNHNNNGYYMCGLSCRTLLHLFLSSCSFPKGSEVLISAVNIPDISVVLRHHGLRPIPFDINLDTLSPSVKDAESKINDKTCAILVAAIYGRRFNITPFLQLKKKYNNKFIIIEDLAEAWCGFYNNNNNTGNNYNKNVNNNNNHNADPDNNKSSIKDESSDISIADLSFYSFGSIKVNTSFGGGIARIKDLALFNSMGHSASSWPIQSNKAFQIKCLKNAAIMLLLNVPFFSGLTMNLAHLTGKDHKAYVVSMLRGFPGETMMVSLSQRVSTAMMAFLNRKLTNFDENAHIMESDFICDVMISLLPSNEKVYCPGIIADERHHWLFPVCVPYPEQTMKLLNLHGVDAYKGATQLALVKDDSGSNISSCPNAAMLMAHVIYLPVHKKVPLQYIVRIANTLEYVTTLVQKRNETVENRSKL